MKIFYNSFNKNHITIIQFLLIKHPNLIFKLYTKKLLNIYKSSSII